MLRLALAFFLSGAAALVFETLWFRVASLSLGSSLWSAAAVLAAFMIGLGLGNLGVARHGWRITRPRRLYVMLEITIGLSGFAIVCLFPLLSAWLAQPLRLLAQQPAALNALRFSVALCLLVLPATAMGATLPVLVRYLQIDLTRAIGRLYGLNTLGAVAGILLAEYLLVPLFGIRGAAGLAAAMNLLAAWLMLARDEPVLATEAPGSGGWPWRLGWLPLFAGMALLALEVVWFRYLLLFRGSTSEAFAIMLAVVLAGIALGGLLASRVPRSVAGLPAIAWLPLAGALACAGSFALCQWLFVSQWQHWMQDPTAFILVAVVLMLPTSLVSGLLFPLIGSAIHAEGRGVAEATGLLTLCNTLGAAIGSLLASFVLLPGLGMERSLLVLAGVYVLLAAWAGAVSRHGGTLRRAGGIALLGALAVWLLFPQGALERNFAVISERAFPGEQLVRVKEGMHETLRYYQGARLGQPANVILVTNMHPMSGTSFRSRRYMKLYVYFPYLFNQQLDNVLQISYGVGNTAEAVVRLPSMRHFDVVDISREVLDNSDLIHRLYGIYPQRDPRTRVHVEDGRFFLQTTPHRYQLITAEPPPPQHAGVVNLYSVEYFRLMKSRLADDGMVTYWLPVHALGEKPSLAIIKAFCEAFADCSLWNGVGLEFMLVGSARGLPPPQPAALRAIWAGPLGDELRAIGFEHPAQVATTFMADAATLGQWTRTIAPVSDDFPHRIVGAAGALPEFAGVYPAMLDIGRRQQLLANSLAMQPVLAAMGPVTALDWSAERLLTAINLPPQLGFAKPGYADLQALLHDSRLRVLPLLLAGSDPAEQALLRKIPAQDTAAYHGAVLAGLLADRQYAEYHRYLEQHRAVLDRSPYATHWQALDTIARTLQAGR